MRKVIDPNAIRSVGEYIEKEKELLIKAQKNMQQHINEILLSYRGKDANILVQRYLNEAEQLTEIINNIDYYAGYMKGLSMGYADNLATTKKEFIRNRLDNETAGDKNV